MELTDEEIKVMVKQNLLQKLRRIELETGGSRMRSDAARVKLVRYIKKLLNELAKKYSRRSMKLGVYLY